MFMAEELEKVFMQKIARMPPEERPVSLKKGKRKGKKTEGQACIICCIYDILRKQNWKQGTLFVTAQPWNNLGVPYSFQNNQTNNNTAIRL